GQLVLPAGVGERLDRGDDRELREAIRATGVLDREMFGRNELAAATLAILDSADSGRPSLVQRGGTDAKRGDRPDSGYDDVAHPLSCARRRGRSRRRR